MSKMLEASCVGGVVTAQGVPVPAAEILSQGVGASTGRVIIDEDDAAYIADISPDLKSVLDNLIDALGQVKTSLDQIGTSLTSIGAGMTGPTTAPPPTLAVDVAVITTASTAIGATKVQLQTLQSALR